jgi:hypothetical protein
MAGDAGDQRLDLETLLALARAGWELHPLRPGKKQPATEHGLKDATTDEATLREWWEARPDLNWGTPSATVADIDDMSQAEAVLATLPDGAPTVRTASGNMHVLMRSDPGRRLPGRLPGRAGEWRARGRGYVVVYDPAVMLMNPPDSLPEVPERHYAQGTAAQVSDDEPLTSRNELIALAGSLRRAGLSEPAILDTLVGMYDRGEITEADPSWPWSEADFATVAKEAGKWAAGEVVPLPKIRVVGKDERQDEPDDDSWLGAVPLSDIEPADPEPLLMGRIHPSGHTILYGTGGVGKGVVAASWIAELTSGDAPRRVLLLDYEQNPDEWARRVAAFGGDPSLVLIANPHGLSWRGTRGPIWKQAGELAALAERWQADFVFVDSIVMAAAGAKDPYSPEAPALYASALELIGRPTVSLAHVNRSDDGRYPFGSVFWHNLARITWSLEAPEDGAQVRVIRNRKANSYKVAPAQTIDWAWVDDEEQLPSDLKYSDLVPSSMERVFYALARLGGKASLDAVTAELPADGFEGMTKSGVGKVLKRYSRQDAKQRFVDHGSGVYALLGKASTGVSTGRSTGHASEASDDVSTGHSDDVHVDDQDVSTEVSTHVHGRDQHRPSTEGVDSVHPIGSDMSTQQTDTEAKPTVTRSTSKGERPKRRNLR